MLFKGLLRPVCAFHKPAHRLPRLSPSSRLIPTRPALRPFPSAHRPFHLSPTPQRPQSAVTEEASVFLAPSAVEEALSRLPAGRLLLAWTAASPEERSVGIIEDRQANPSPEYYGDLDEALFLTIKVENRTKKSGFVMLSTETVGPVFATRDEAIEQAVDDLVASLKRQGLL